MSAPENLGRQFHSIPAAPGTAPIPEGHVRLFHYTHPDSVASIAQHGLRQASALGHTYGEPSMVWATAGVPGHGALGAKPYVEFHADPNKELDIGHGRSPEELEGHKAHVTFYGSVHPSNIIGIHEPWHQTVHYLEGDAGHLERWTSGESKDETTGDHRTDRALAYVREKHARGLYK